jgi:hypothetical protein
MTRYAQNTGKQPSMSSRKNVWILSSESRYFQKYPASQLKLMITLYITALERTNKNKDNTVLG